ncbi:MAG: hypothetical protein K1X79_02455 [Oligoflexia bacterium]|nr:hypothetical protein [Oligoflexia bacterium]
MTNALLADRFELLECLRHNEIAALYLASDHKERNALKSLQVYVGLKLIDRTSIGDTCEDDIKQIVAKLSVLKNPHVLCPYEVHKIDNILAISCESLRGISLADLSRCTVFSVSESLQICIAVLKASRFLLSNNVDGFLINAENIYLDRTGNIKVDPIQLATPERSKTFEAILCRSTAELALSLLSGRLSNSPPPLRKFCNYLASPLRCLWRMRSAHYRRLLRLIRTTISASNAGHAPGLGQLLGQLSKLDKEVNLGNETCAPRWSQFIDGYSERDIVSSGSIFVALLSFWSLSLVGIFWTLTRIENWLDRIQM